MVSAGDLNQRVTIQQPVYNSGGDEIVGWSAIATVWAAIRHMRGRELIDSGRDTSEQFATIRIRYRTGLDHAQRIVHKSTNYDIEAISNVNEENAVLELTCKAVK